MPLRSIQPVLLLCTVLIGFDSRADDTVVEEPGEKLMGTCFENARDAVRAVFGASGLTDENIAIHSVRSLKDGSRWMIDHTPGHNFAWFLLQPNKERQLCLTLFIPAACCVEVKRNGKTQTAVAKTQVTLGPSKQVTYQRQKGASVFSFEPQSCLKITYAEEGGELSRQQFPCSNRFYYD